MDDLSEFKEFFAGQAFLLFLNYSLVASENGPNS